MDVGAAGNLIIFFCTGVAFALVSLIVLAYSGYSFLTVLVNTAAGNDEVIWPGDPLQDWLFKGWYLMWIAVLCAMPGCLLATVVGWKLLDPQFTLMTGLSIWLCFPVCLLSSLSASSRMIVVRSQIISRLLAQGGRLIGFYFAGGLIVIAALASVYFGVVQGPAIVLPLTAVAAAICALTYARLLGRIAALVSRGQSGRSKGKGPSRPEEADLVETFDPWSVPDEAPRKPVPEPEPPPRKPARKKKRKKSDLAGYDPWAMPEEEAPVEPARTAPPAGQQIPGDPYGPAEGSYDLLDDRASLAPPKPVEQPAAQLETEAYGMKEAAEADITKTQPATVPEVSKLELELAAPKRLPRLPRSPLLEGVYSFPYYSTTLGPLFTLSLGTFGVTALARALIALYPF